ncbi:site-specific integrase [Vibrio parahaemolyticus]|nr:site-specific integrase [Vibrio parahaemolyticus]
MEVITYHLKDFKYRTPISFVDENGELTVSYTGKPIQIAPISLLYKIDFDDDGNIINAVGIDEVNAYLMFLKLNRNRDCVSVQSRALLHYFAFLEDEENRFRDKMAWDKMPRRTSSRPTYRFKAYLESAYKSKDEGDCLGKNTSKAYMRAVINFYKYYIMIGHHFENPPFEYEEVTIVFKNKYNKMKPTQRRVISTTDLRLKLSDDQLKSDIPRPLQAISRRKWDKLSEILKKHRKVVVIQDGKEIIHPLAIEYSYIFLLMRYAGLRRREVLTLREHHIFNPSEEQIEKGYVNVSIGPKNGVETKHSKDRTIEIPSYLMRNIFKFLQEPRSSKRREKCLNNFNPTHGAYAFLSRNGDRIKPETVNARWSEIRKTYKKLNGEDLLDKPHNLRSTYAVERLKAFLNVGMKTDKAVSIIQARLGHDDLAVTLLYLKQTEYDLTGDEVYEHAFDFIFDNEEFTVGA